MPKTYNDPKSFVHSKGGDWMWSPAQTQVSPALSRTGRPHHPPSLAWLSSASTPEWWKGKCGLKLRAQPGLQTPGGPLGTSGGPSFPCRGAALSRGLSCFFAFCCDGAPQLSQGDGKSVGVTCSCLRWGNVIAALTRLTRYWESVKHKWQGEQSKTEKEK